MTRHYLIAAVLVIIPLITGVVAAYQYLDGVKKEQEVENKTNALVKAQEKIVSLQNEAMRQISGEGFARAEITVTDDTESLRLFIRSLSEYPLYDVEVAIYDFSGIKKKCKHKEQNGKIHIWAECLQSVQKKITTLPKTYIPGEIHEVTEFSEYGERQTLFIKIKMRHMTIYQYSLFYYDPYVHYADHSYRIFRVNKNETEFELLMANNGQYNEQDFENKFFYKKPLAIHYTSMPLK